MNALMIGLLFAAVRGRGATVEFDSGINRIDGSAAAEQSVSSPHSSGVILSPGVSSPHSTSVVEGLGW